MKEFKKKKIFFVKGIRGKIEKKMNYIINIMILNYTFYVLKFKIYYLKLYNY